MPARAVLDASTLLKGAADEEREPGADHARRILPPLAERYGLAGPSLLAWETANVVHRKHPEAFGDGVYDRADLVRLLLDGIELVGPDPEEVRLAGRLAEEHDLTVYDGAYLRLAASRDGLLVTEDGPLRRAGEEVLGADRVFDAEGARGALDEGRV